MLFCLLLTVIASQVVLGVCMVREVYRLVDVVIGWTIGVLALKLLRKHRVGSFGMRSGMPLSAMGAANLKRSIKTQTGLLTDLQSIGNCW